MRRHPKSLEPRLAMAFLCVVVVVLLHAIVSLHSPRQASSRKFRALERQLDLPEGHAVRPNLIEARKADLRAGMLARQQAVS